MPYGVGIKKGIRENSFDITRREFLISSLASIHLLTTPNYNLFADPKISTELLLAPEMLNKNYSLGIIDLSTEKSFHIDCEYRGHSLIYHNKSNELATMIAQRPGKVSYLFDVKKKKILSSFKSYKDHYFYGHGLYVKNGTELWTAENHDKTGNGIIVIRSFPDLKILGTFETGGYTPHEFKLINNEKEIVVANGGDAKEQKDQEIYQKIVTESSLTYIDVKNKNINKKLASPFKSMSMRHLDVYEKENMSVFVMKRDTEEIKEILPCLAYQIGDSPIQFFDRPKDIDKTLRSFGLSLKISQDGGVAAATNPEANMVTFWDLKKKKYIGKYELHYPLGVTPAKDNSMWVITNNKYEIHFIDFKTLLPIKRLSNKFRGLNAFHIENSKIS